MKFPRIKTVLLAVLALFALAYIFGALALALKDDPVAPFKGTRATYETVAIFGASGTAGDGILKAALANPEIAKIHVITRRATPRIEAGVASGKVEMTVHMDYLDYSAIQEKIADVDAVYWAIGISAVGVDEETYGMIHVDFPAQFLTEWTQVSDKPAISFHFVSSSDISKDSSMMWVREKIRAERTLFDIAAGTHLKVIAYRPDYIGPTDEEAHIGQDILYWFFAPIGAAVRAEQIGKAMSEVSARIDDFESGDKLSTRSIIRYGEAFDAR